MPRRPARGAVPRRGRAGRGERRSGAEHPSAKQERQRSGRPPAAPILYCLRHVEAASGAFRRFLHAPFHTLLTIAVLGIALALPAAFFLLLDNVERLAGGWEGGAPRISLFLDRDLATGEVEEAAASLLDRDDVVGVETIHPDEALAELRGASELDEALALLDENPLPPVVVAVVATGLSPDEVGALADELASVSGVERMRLDREWVERLDALLTLAERAVWFTVALLAVAVALVVGNTIRLAIENRRQEIEITKLMGGSNGFVRRPFLYEGLWYGAAGGALAWILTGAGRWAIAEPAQRLADLYGGGFRIEGTGLEGGLALLGSGAALGLVGAWLAVGRHLAAIEPR